MNDLFAPVRDVHQELVATVQGATASGEGERFRLRPKWPTVAQLEYVQKFATAGLLVLGIVFLAGYALRDPRGAAGFLAHAGTRRLGG